MKHFETAQASNLAPASGNSPVVRRVSPGRIIVWLFWAKYVVPHQIKPRILNLTIRRGQSTICIVFISVRCAENAIIVSFRQDSSVLTAARTAGAAAVCKNVIIHISVLLFFSCVFLPHLDKEAVFQKALGECRSILGYQTSEVLRCTDAQRHALLDPGLPLVGSFLVSFL